MHIMFERVKAKQTNRAGLQGGARNHNFYKEDDEGKEELWRILNIIMLHSIPYGRFC